MITPYIDEITEAANRVYPNELCGVITPDGFIAMSNVHEEPAKAFAFDPIEWRGVKDNTLCIVHTHSFIPDRFYQWDVRSPSTQDYRMFKKLGIPWVIFASNGISLSEPVWLPRLGSSIYVDRQFIWYINDCYTLVQDYYKFELDIILPDHDTRFDYGNRTMYTNLFDAFVESYGFTQFYSKSNLQNGDLLLVDHRGIRNGHLGIYHNGSILHQDSISKIVPMDYFENHIHKMLRYIGDKDDNKS